MKNFKSEIGCVIVCKMLIYRKIRGYLEMTNEKVRIRFQDTIVNKRTIRTELL